MTDDVDAVVTLRWVTRCLRCGYEEVDEQAVSRGAEYGPPTAPTRCEGCGESLRNDPLALSQTFTVEDVVEMGGRADE